MSAPSGLPLQGVVVLDLTQIYNGPYATFLMAMAGAHVIKVEPPGGEHLRKRNRSNGVTEPFAVLNANKQSITLNLRVPEGREVLLQLAEKADVVVENFAPGVMNRLGLGEDVFRQRNPKLILASSSGYGTSGPYKAYPAMDLTVQAMSGVMSITGTADGPPLKAGPAICDFSAGIHLYAAIVTALYQRVTTGKAGTVEVAMMSTVYPSLLSSLGMHRKGDTKKPRTGNRHGGLSMAPYNVYPSADGYLAILSANEGHWVAIAKALGRPEWLMDPRFVDRSARIAHMDELDAEIGAMTSRHPKQHLFEMLAAARVPCAPVRELDEVANDEHLLQTGMIRNVQHPEYGEVLVHGSPLQFKGQAAPAYRPSSALGADTKVVLDQQLGTDDAAFAALVSAGAFS